MHIILTQSDNAFLELYGTKRKRISVSLLKGYLIRACLLSSQQMWHLNVVSNGQKQEVILRNKWQEPSQFAEWRWKWFGNIHTR